MRLPLTSVILVALAVAGFGPVGCGGGSSSAPAEQCRWCGGTGRTARGACVACAGRGHQEPAAPTDRQRLAEENVRRADRGDAALTDAEWWVSKNWKLCAFAAVGLLAFVVRIWSNQDSPPAASTSSPAPPVG